MKKQIVIGSRGSRLAMVQSESVAAALRKANSRLEVSIKKIVTAGDRDHRTDLDRIGVAVFVKELEEALLEGSIDLAVHSLKDMPVDTPEGLCILAIGERADCRDVLVAKSKLRDLPAGATIGTDSLRRSVQLYQLRPDLQVRGIRGNVDTRLRKAASGEFDGVIVAAAAMSRLGWQDKITEYLPADVFLPAVGQGALAIEGRFGDREIAGIVAPLNHASTAQSVTAERAFLRALGGGCRAPIAALGLVNGTNLKLEGMVASVREHKVVRLSETGSALSPDDLGLRLAKQMLATGAGEYIAEVRG